MFLPVKSSFGSDSRTLQNSNPRGVNRKPKSGLANKQNDDRKTIVEKILESTRCDLNQFYDLVSSTSDGAAAGTDTTATTTTTASYATLSTFGDICLQSPALVCNNSCAWQQDKIGGRNLRKGKIIRGN